MELLVHTILVVRLDPISLLSLYFYFYFKSPLKTNMHLLIKKKKKSCKCSAPLEGTIYPKS